MSHYKIYKSGSNYEIYHYEKMPKIDEERYNFEDKVKAVKDEDTGFWTETELQEKEKQEYTGLTKEQLKDKRRMQLMRDNRNAIRRMAREYFSGDDVFFFTWTYSDRTIKSDSDSLDKAEEHFKYMMKKMRRKLGDVSYLAVRELQKDGTLHYHAFVKCEAIKESFKDIPPAIKKGKKRISSEEQKAYERYYHKTFWPHGWVTIFKLDDCDNVGAYLTKYMTKGDVESMRWLEGRKMYLMSKDIKKVEALDANENSEIIKSIIDLLPYYKSIAEEDIYFNVERKRVFTNGYDSEFNGQVRYFDINIERIEKASENCHKTI